MLQTVAADVTLTDSEADAATITTADVVSAITAACGSSFSYAAAAGCGNNNGCGCGDDMPCLWIILLLMLLRWFRQLRMWKRMLLIHPSHCFRYDSGWSLYSISFFMYISTLFLIYIYNVKGRNCHGKENTQGSIAAVR